MSDYDDDIPDELWGVIDALGEGRVRHAAAVCPVLLHSTTHTHEPQCCCPSSTLLVVF
jgi:hypothetical protein